MEKAAEVAREEVVAAAAAKVVVAAAAAAKVVAAAEDKATPVDGQARPATLQVEAGRTQRHPSELDSGAMPMVTRGSVAPGGETIHRQVAKRKGRVRPLVDRREVKSEGKSGFGGPEARSLPTIRQRPRARGGRLGEVSHLTRT